MAGRKNVYDSKIKPRFDDIKKWLEKGATERSIAKNLGIAYSTLNKYKIEKKEFAELLKNNRTKAVDEIENAMYKAAIGGKQTLLKAMKVKRVKYDEQGRKIEYETVENYKEDVYFPPNTTAGIYLLKHWARNKGYTNDPASLELKKQELELKKQIAADEHW